MNQSSTMDRMAGVGQPQRKQVVSMLMELLRSCYPAQHEYLLFRARQYEFMCYERASNVEQYYQLVSEGFRKIRTTYNGLHTAPDSALASSVGQQVNAGMPNAQTPVGATAQSVRHNPLMVNQALQTTANHASNPANRFDSINCSNPPNPANSAIPVNSVSPAVYHTNLPGPAHIPVTQQINHIPASKKSYLVNPATTVSQPSPLGDARFNQFANPTLNHRIYTSSPYATRPPIPSMINKMGKHVVTPTVNPSLNLSNHISPKLTANPNINPAVNPEVQFINQMNGRVSDQIINQMDMTAESRAEVHPRNTLTAPVQASGHQTKMHQQHSNGVNQLLLSMGMIPESMVSGVPTSNVNIQRVPMASSNQFMPIAQTSMQPPRQPSTAQKAPTGKKNMSKTNQVAASVAESSSSQPRTVTQGPLGGPLSHAGQPVSMNSAGSKRARPREKTIQRSGSKKRNSSAAGFTAGINQQENSSAVAQHGHYQALPKRVFNSVRPGSSAPSYHQNSWQGIAHTQRQPDSPSAQSPNLDEQLSLSGPSMNEPISISDTIHLPLRQVYNAAASCGYKLTAEKIKSLSKEQLLRFLITAPQMTLKQAGNLPRGDNGQINVSKQQLDTLGVEYGTAKSAREHTANGTSNLNGIQNSSPQIVQHDSVPANMEMNRTDMMPHAGNLLSTAYQTNRASQDTTKNALRNSVQELPNYRDSGGVGASDVAIRRASSCTGPTDSARQGTEKMRAVQCRKTASQVPVVSSKGMRANTAQGAGNISGKSQKLPVTTAAGVENVITGIGAQLSQKRSADTRTLRNCAATLSSRVTLFQQKYTVYKNLISQTLQLLLSMGHEGKKEVLYLRYSMQLLTQPGALRPKLTMPVLNTTENFLRDFLVRHQGIPMKSDAKKSNQTDALKARGSSTTNDENKNKSSNAHIHATNHAKIATIADTEKGTDITRTTKGETGREAIREAEIHQSDSIVKSGDATTGQKGTSATPPAQTSAPSEPVSAGGIQNLTLTAAPIEDENVHSVIAQKLNRVNHWVRVAVHAAEKCEKYLEQESMLRVKDERISEICYLFQEDNMKKARESKGTADAVGASESSLLKIIKAECDGAYKKHKKLMINIVEKWNKPVVECLLAYQCIRLPKIVIHVGGTYRKDLSVSIGFERPQFGWVSVLTDIKKRFNALMDNSEGVRGVLEAWATAAGEVLKDEDV